MSGPPSFRAFIALDNPEGLVERLRAAQQALKVAGIEQALGTARAVWVQPQALHLTLRFLGSITEEQAAQVTEAMRHAAAKTAPLSLILGEIGAFPSLKRPRVLWMGVDDGGAVAALEAALSEELSKIGVTAEERPFHPHFTLMRIKDGRNRGRRGRGSEPRRVSHDVTRVVHTAFGPPERDPEGKSGQGRVFVVYTYSLFGSSLTPHGPRYERRAGVPLGGENNPYEP